MKFIKYGIAIIMSGFFSLSALAHDPKGESFTLSGTITSVELTDGGGTITVSSEAGRYGKVFLTYNVSLNSALPEPNLSGHRLRPRGWGVRKRPVGFYRPRFPRPPHF